MTSLGVCGAFLADGSRCHGHVIAVGHVGSLVEGECEKCGTTAAVPALKVDPGVARQRRIEQASLPRRFFGAPFEETADNRSAVEHVRDWIGSYHSTPLPAPALWGRAGRGKSHLLTAVCLRLIRERDQSVLYRATRGLLRELQDFDNAEQVWQRAVTVDVLALDDLGAERSTEWRHDQLADLVDARYEAERPILLATNFPPQAWPESMDERTASRLRGMTFPVELRGADRRVPQPVAQEA